MPTKTIAVHGATGSQGAPVAAALAAVGHNVRPVTRASGADLLDRASLEAAYGGADTVVLQLPVIYDESVLRMADNAARAAEAAGVAHLVINASGPMAPEPIGVPFLDARHRAAAADIAGVTVLAPTTYLENLSAPWSAERVARHGVVAYPMPGEVPMAWVATDDVAGAVERAIAREVAGWFALPGIATAGHDIAEALGQALGRPVQWETIAPEAYADLLRPYLGDHAADGTAAVYRMLATSPPAPAADPTPARDALGWAPRDVTAWARGAAWPLARAT
ncbi:MAG: NmrA family NAD(P)-binding protein [Solirubrobacteraceae bacterium]